MGAFSKWQLIYAAVAIPTFPVRIEDTRKIPMVKRYGRIGLNGSTELARKFSNAEMLATMLNSYRMIADVDTRADRFWAMF